MHILCLILIPILLLACRADTEPPAKPSDSAIQSASQVPAALQPPTPSAAEEPATAPPSPPMPPIFEDFQGQPQLSLFARVGDYRPEDHDSIALPFWRTYMDHLLKTTGVGAPDDQSNRAFALRSIKGLDSVGFFSPLAVTPNTGYQVSVLARTQLPEGASAGVGILEYDEFIWLSEQYPQTLDEQHRRGQHAGIQLSGTSDWSEYRFRFTTGPQAGMIHLVIYRDGTPSRDPVLFDNIRIDRVDPQ
ncbi:MAG: hypothetical protein ACYDAI_04785 [Trichloromonadaceae bacterium]